MLEGIAYIGVVVQAAIMATLKKSDSWLLAVNLTILFVYAVASILSQWLPRRERRPRVLDVHHARELQIKYANLLDETNTHRDSLECLEVLGDGYTQQAFEGACRAVCADRRSVRVSWMTEDDDHTLRVKIIYPGEGDHTSRTAIPLDIGADGCKIPPAGVGVGGFAYGLCRSVYVPNVRRGGAYLVDASLHGTVTYEWLGACWIDSGSRRYKSVISVPVYVREKGERRPLGVLNYESPARDSFGSADFHVACLMAGLLALGLRHVMAATEAVA